MLSLHVYHRIQKHCECPNYDAIPNISEIGKRSPTLILGQPDITFVFRSGRIAHSTFRFLSQLWKFRQYIETCYTNVTCSSTHIKFAKLLIFNKFQLGNMYILEHC